MIQGLRSGLHALISRRTGAQQDLHGAHVGGGDVLRRTGTGEFAVERGLQRVAALIAPGASRVPRLKHSGGADVILDGHTLCADGGQVLAREIHLKIADARRGVLFCIVGHLRGAPADHSGAPGVGREVLSDPTRRVDILIAQEQELVIAKKL